MKKNKYSSIETIISISKKGGMYILVDDENRENEGDFVAAAEVISPEIINFMAKHGRGLICAPITNKLSKKLKLNLMVGSSSDPQDTAFTVSVDYKGNGVSTGISAADRSKTIKALIDPKTKPHQFSKPGHVFPLIAKDGGVLRRTGHTEAAIDFARLAGFKPAGVIVEIMNDDGTMARLPELKKVAKKFDLKIISIEDLVAYRMAHDSLIEKREDFEIETRFGRFRLRAYEQTTNHQLHIALTKGVWEKDEPVLTRINSKVTNNDILGAITNGREEKLDNMFKVINDNGKGAIIFINQENQSLNTLKRLKILKTKQKKNTVVKAPKVEMDIKDFGIGAQILHDLDIHKLRLISNGKKEKRVGMIGYGLEITEYIKY